MQISVVSFCLCFGAIVFEQWLLQGEQWQEGQAGGVKSSRMGKGRGSRKAEAGGRQKVCRNGERERVGIGGGRGRMRRGASGVSKGRSRVGTAGKQEQEEGLGKRQEAGQQNRVQPLGEHEAGKGSSRVVAW